MKKSKQVTSLLLLFVIAIGMIFTTGCSKKADPANTLVVTVGDNKIYMNEVMFYIYNVEATGSYYDKSYQQYYGTSYWDIETEGQTMRDSIKQYVMDTVIMTEILYEKAISEGFTITEEEKSTNQTKVDQLLTSVTEDQLKLTGFTNDLLLKIFEKITIGDKYYAKVADTLEVDEQEVTASIKKEDYKQYDTAFIFVPTTKFDENQSLVEFSEEEKLASKKSIDTVLEQVKAGTDFATIVEKDPTIISSTRNFVFGDNSSEKNYQEAAVALEKGSFTTEPVLTEYGYYIIKLLDNEGTDSYDNAVQEAIITAQTEAFKKEYEVIKKDYTITINEKAWNPIVMGETTLIESDTTDTTDENTKEADTTESSSTEANTSEANTSETNTTESNNTESK